MVKAVERFVVVAPIPGRPMAFGGTVLETLSNSQVVESALTEIPIDELNEWIESLNAVAIADNLRLQSELSAMTTERDALTTEKAALTSERDSALEQVAELKAELDAIKNPPNPFPDADWQGFRSAALASPTIMRMAMSNMGNFMMLLIYMTEMQKDPTATTKMVGVWNEMETKTPISADEIAAINQLAAQYQVPMVLNSEGQIVL